MATITVTNNSDNLPGSLRQAIISAVSGDTIDFAPALSGATIVLTSGELTIAKNLSIINNNPLNVTVSGNNATRVFSISATFIVSMSGLTITNGRQAFQSGAGILNFGNLTITLCTISDNSNGNSNDPFGGAGIYNGSVCNMTYSTVSGNRIATISNFGGAGIFNNGIFNMTYCTVNDNNTAATGSNVNGGGIVNDGSAAVFTIVNSTINGNMARFTRGGGIYVSSGVVTLTNTTISSNTVNDDGSGNGVGGGVYNNAGTINVGNTIIARNTATSGATSPDVFGPFTSNGNNIIGNTTGSTGFGGSDQIGVNPLLNPLGNYGGPTQTRTLQPASTAIDGGNNALVPVGIIYDQRGPGFPRIINGIVDIGAIEAGVICFSGESLVLAKNKLTNEISEVRAKELYSDTHEIFDTINEKFIPIKYNIITGRITRYMKIKKNSLGENKPNEDFLVTSGHKILYNGTEIKASQIPGAIRIKVKPEIVYSICTEEKTAIKINNLDVMTWGESELLKYSVKRGLSWENNLDKSHSLKMTAPNDDSIFGI